MKLTDKEIIKALECCTNNEDCLNCPLQDDYANCNPIGAALDLINRQQAEIERLGKRLEAVQGAKCVYSYDGETLEYCTASPCPIYKTAEQIKSEAIKEFAERLKEKLDCDVHTSEGFYFMVSDTIDNLVKEMVGGTE